MFQMLATWYRARFSDPQRITLVAIILFLFCIIYFFSNLLMPLLIAIVFAYLLEWPTAFLHQKCKIPRVLSVVIVLGVFLVSSIMVLSSLAPALWNQTSNFLQDLPTIFNNLNNWVQKLPENYPDLVNERMIGDISFSLQTKIVGFGNSILNFSINSIASLVTIGIYSFLVPFMTFFLLKDKDIFLQFFSKIMPENIHLTAGVWREMKMQIANYIRGKVIEIIIVSIATYAILLVFGLKYPLLFSVLTGLSALIPYVGAVLVTIPIVIVAIVQFGVDNHFYYLMLAYVICQLIDGNVVVPLLFSDAVNLHPLIIIVSVIIFGGLWGFWGVFFAIPLATLIKAVFNAFTQPYQENSV